MFNKRIKISLFFSLLYTIYAIICIYYGEKIPVNNNLGWDGRVYANIIQNFHQVFKLKLLSIERTHKIAPCAIIYVIAKIFGVLLVDKTIVFLFGIFNLGCMLFSICISHKISNLFKLNNKQYIITLSSLFINYSFMKFIYYYPALIDGFVLLLSLILLYAYLKKNNCLLIILIIIGGFTHQQIFIVSILLYIFNNIKLKKETPKKNTYNLALILTIITCFILCAKLLIVIFQNPDLNYHHNLILSSENKYFFIANGQLLIITFGFSLYYIYNALLQYTFSLNKFLNKVLLFKICFAGILFSLIKIIIAYITNEKGLTVNSYLTYVLHGSCHLPFKHLISHMIYFGPSIFIIIWNYKKIISIICKKGLGLLLGICFLTLFTIDAESRHNIVFLVFVIFIMPLTLKNINKRFIIYYVMLCLIFSKFWFSINPLLVNQNAINWPYNTDWERYFMNFGPWLSLKYYLLHLLIIIPSILLIFYLNFKTTKTFNE